MVPGLVSVVIPCFNAEKTISDTIDSVLDQTYSRREVILVDDGSQDNSARIIMNYGDLVHLELGPNRGASSARNHGSELARGEFIQYLDADDLLTAGTLERRVSAIMESNSDVAYTDWQKFQSLGNGGYCYLDKIERDMTDVDVDPEIACATQFWAPPAALLYRRRIVEKIGGWKEDLPIIQDARFLFDAAHHGAKFIRVPSVGAYYRTSVAGSLSSKDQHQFMLDVMHNAEQIQIMWSSANKLTRKRKKALRSVYEYTARNFFLYDEEQFKSSLRNIRTLGLNGKSTYVTLSAKIYKVFGIRRARLFMKFATKARRLAYRASEN